MQEPNGISAVFIHPSFGKRLEANKYFSQIFIFSLAQRYLHVRGKLLTPAGRIMTVELGAPPKAVARRKSYTELTEKIVQADGEWLRLSPDEVGGESFTDKQSRIGAVTHSRGLQVQTPAQAGAHYVRLLKEQV